jgi:cytoskeletal protein RodZ
VESIGEKLRNAREAKKLSMKDVAKDSNIPPRYLEALEEEEFDRFPGETYVIGFLRSYADYLKLDSEEIIQLYKGYKIGESATPIAELTKPTRSQMMIDLSGFYNTYKNYIYVGAIALSVLLVIVVFSSVFSSGPRVNENDVFNAMRNQGGDQKNSYIGNYTKLVLQNDVGYAIVAKNEGVFFSVDQRDAMFILRDIKDGNSVTLEISPGNMVDTIVKDQPKVFNIKGCPREVEFTLKAVAENSANVKVKLGRALGPEAQTAVTDDEGAPKTDATSSQVIARNEKNLNIVFDAEFNQKSFIEVYLDGMLKRRGMIPSGIKERWEATSHIQVRIGNAGGVKVKINGQDYNWGGPGAVANKVVTWKKDGKDPNVYHIVVKDW